MDGTVEYVLLVGSVDERTLKSLMAPEIPAMEEATMSFAVSANLDTFMMM